MLHNEVNNLSSAVKQTHGRHFSYCKNLERIVKQCKLPAVRRIRLQQGADHSETKEATTLKGRKNIHPFKFLLIGRHLHWDYFQLWIDWQLRSCSSQLSIKLSKQRESGSKASMTERG